MTSISLAGVSKAFGFECAVLEMDLEIASGEFVVFVGPSGCGKSTLLRMIAGLEAVSGGRILFDNIDVTALPPDKRDVAMVFQSYALYPHMTAAQNLSFGLRMTGCRAADIARRVEHAVDMLRLEDYLHKKPSQLSGGQCQRVAIGRALVQQPKVFLFDEPLSNLDAELRVSMRVEIAALHRSLDNTMIYVTHDQVEAMTLADRIVVLRNGGIEQVGTPREIYGEPQNVFVAEFMGYPKINILQGTVVDDGGIFLRLDSMARIPLGVLSGAVEVGEKVSVGIRPESISLKQQAHKQQAQGAQFEMFVDFVEHVGAGTNYFGRIGGDEFRIALSEGQKYQPGDPVRIGLAEEQLHFFDARGERLGKRQTPE